LVNVRPTYAGCAFTALRTALEMSCQGSRSLGSVLIMIATERSNLGK
jgi:hypothetical protein